MFFFDKNFRRPRKDAAGGAQAFPPRPPAFIWRRPPQPSL